MGSIASIFGLEKGLKLWLILVTFMGGYLCGRVIRREAFLMSL